MTETVKWKDRWANFCKGGSKKMVVSVQSIQGLFKNWQNWQEQAENFLMKHVGD